MHFAAMWVDLEHIILIAKLVKRRVDIYGLSHMWNMKKHNREIKTAKRLYK